MSKTGKTVRENVPRVFISSTSDDLEQHRAAAGAAANGAGFLPIQMEYFAASGQHKPLEACLQKVSEADVLVVIVAYRYGWVPDEQQAGQDKSITWLECEKAHADKKEVLAFVADQQHTWDTELKEQYRIAADVSQATPELLAEVQRNVRRLEDFKAWIDRIGVRAKFTTPEDIRGKVSESLRDWKQRNASPETQPIDDALAQSEKPAFPPAYRDWLERQCADIDLVGLHLKEVRSVRLNRVYVPLTTPAGRDQPFEDASKQRERSAQEPQSDLLLGRLNDESLYVSGAPGSGKSTFCRWVAWLACTGNAPDQRHEEETDDYREQYPDALRGYLPILVRLRDFWKCLPQDAGQELSLAQLGQSLERWLAAREPGGLTWKVVQAHLDRGNVLIIFDGVDEVPISHGEATAAWYPRTLLLSGLADAVDGWTSQGNRLLVTSRPYGLDESERHKLRLPEARIDDLPRPLQHLLAARWFRILTEDTDSGTALARDMLAHIQQRPGIDPLTSNPMLLTAICIIYHEGKRLPQDRCDLYGRIVDNVLYNRIRDPAIIEMVRNELRVVAHGMHTGQAVQQERTTPEAEVEFPEIDQILESYRQQSRWSREGFEGVVASREHLLANSGLLLPRADRRAGFYHFSIQEFLAAERLSALSNEQLAELFGQRAAVPEWHNTLSFLFGSVQIASVDRSVQLVENLLSRVAPDELGLQVVIGDALQLLLAKNIRLHGEREEAFRRLCLSAVEREVSLRERNLLGLALGHLGDPRITTNLRDASAYVEIPAGEYAYQDGKQTIDQPFLLSKYPVTNSQFAVFVGEGGYEDEALWSQEGWRWQETEKLCEPRHWQNAKFNAPNQPVVGVSFYEAEAFCKWVGGFLPSERQWEAAARGPQRLKYPWGNQWKDGICNSDEAGLGVTSPVGLFPGSRSRDFGLEDLAGNVWEWCSDLDTTIWDNGRVLRGGSWYYQPGVCRSAVRDIIHPVSRDYGIGFRAARTYS